MTAARMFRFVAKLGLAGAAASAAVATVYIVVTEGWQGDLGRAAR